MTTPEVRPDEVTKPKDCATQWFVLIAIFAVGLALRVGVALRSPSIEWPDEIFNTLEPAHRLVYGYGVIRVGVARRHPLLGLSGLPGWRDASNSVDGTRLARISDRRHRRSVAAFAGLCVVRVRVGEENYRDRSGMDRSRRLSPRGISWCTSRPKPSPKYSPQIFFCPACTWECTATSCRRRNVSLLAGICLGIAVCVRMQYAPAVAFAVLWFCGKQWKTRAPALLAGLLLPVIVFGVVDAFTWSYPFQSYIRYFQMAYLSGRNTHYGVEPWYIFFVALWRTMWPMLLLAVFAVKRNELLAWVVAITVVTHSADRA